MSQGMFSAVSGVRANQARLNVISNNIANVNTVGFKSSSMNFATVFSQTISGGSAPNGTLGGTNPKQIGSGVLVSEIPANFAQGGTQFTGKSTDLMINGDGFFAVERVDNNLGIVSTDFYLSRAGNFSLDSDGNLTTAAGNRVRGTSQLSGSLPSTLTTVNIPQQLMIIKDFAPGTNTLTRVHYAAVGTATAAIQAQYYDGVAVTGAPAAGDQLIRTASLVGFTIGPDGAVTAKYDNGDIISVRTDNSTVNAANPSAARREIIHIPQEQGTFAGNNVTASDNGLITQIPGSEAFFDGSGGASLEGMQLQLQTAKVTNPAGLLYDGGNNFLISANSGITSFGIAANEGRGGIQAGALESSNVDLAGEFTNLVITQRGLEASSRVIRTQSEVMQTIIQAV